MSRYEKSEKVLARAQKTIPLGAQTFSKSITQFPLGISPFFADRAQGSHLWDVDGNEYVDFINGLASVTLGYADPDINKAVASQLEKGVTFTLSSPLEAEVAEKIVSMVPSAEMVRFGKNGSDTTSAAIRIARASTGRSHVLVCGYHGWQDWYIGSTTRNLGVPKETQELTHLFKYNDIESLTSLLNQYDVAAVILEPCNYEMPRDNFLEKVKAETQKAGAVLVFDETITGFRYGKGGAQEYFGVTPDLSTFGKGLANGFPLSAVVGKKDLMKLMEEIFFSTTFAGETVSLAAANVVLDKINTQPILETMAAQGEKVLKRTNDLISKHGLGETISLSGHPVWTFLHFKDTPSESLWTVRTFFMQEMFASGILSFGTHNMNYCHSDDDVDFLMKAYEGFFQKLSPAIAKGDIHTHLKSEALKPLFKVR